jgi:cysteine desulfurase
MLETSMEQIYLDHAATTPVRTEVIATMLPYLEERWGNPSSIHHTGIRALEGVERARERVAALLGAETDEIVFTGSGTEADNHALIGVWLAQRERRPHVIVSAIEHHAVLDTADFLETLGAQVTRVLPNSEGIIEPEAIASALRDDTSIVSIMHANNEMGAVQPIAEIGALCRTRGVVFHADAVQTAGHLPINVNEFQLDLLSLSAHKLYGPKGVGALYLRAGTPIRSFLHGGRQELGRRASTENVAGIVGLGEAARLAAQEMTAESAHCSKLRDALISGLLARVPEIMLTGSASQRLPNNASFLVAGAEGEALVLEFDAAGFAVSSGSACTSGTQAPSHVLLAMGLTPEQARSSLRLSVGRDTTRAQIEAFLEAAPEAIARARAANPLSMC